ncbi:hypothetical protein M758_UG320400 [Ceratodon purpureus]|nr:hypothetical protein M758_UG320400 [Ceratodon purpureus]
MGGKSAFVDSRSRVLPLVLCFGAVTSLVGAESTCCAIGGGTASVISRCRVLPLVLCFGRRTSPVGAASICAALA